MLFDDEPGDDPRLRSRACLWRPLLLVSPRSSPVSTAPEKFQADSAPLTLPGWETVAPAPGAEPHSPSAKLDASVSARYILLMTFRI
jgi:hypothetical protein